MSEKRLSEDDILGYREALTLPLLSDASPFDLAEDERKFRPEDWAWLFLSLNQDYKDAYSEHFNDAEADLSSKMASSQILGLKADHSNECAKRFGLSAWVSPSISRLPKLLEPNDSWFFPLKRLVLESHPAKYPQSPGAGKYALIHTNQDLFGYRPPLRIPYLPDTPRKPKQRVEDTSSWSNIWVAVDCSIPPAGQVSALFNLAKATRKKLQAENWADHDDYWDCDVCDIASAGISFGEQSFLAAGATDKVTDPKSVWRAVVIDPLGSVVTQRDRLLQMLQTVHRDFVARGLAKAPPFERFNNTLPSRQDGDGVYRNGGSYLKVLFTLAELRSRGLNDPNNIAKVLGTYSPNDRYPYNWMRDFHFNLEQYVDEARAMVEGDYRQLIHAQKPA